MQAAAMVSQLSIDLIRHCRIAGSQCRFDMCNWNVKLACDQGCAESRVCVAWKEYNVGSCGDQKPFKPTHNRAVCSACVPEPTFRFAEGFGSFNDLKNTLDISRS